MTKMFGTDGIRGHVGEWPLVPEFCLRLGRVAGKILKAEMGSLTLVVGRDPRRSGQMLMEALAAGLLASGAEVIDVGVIPTPGVSWLLKEVGADAGVVISASHNPVEQNGIKFFSKSGYKLPEEIEATIEEGLLVEGEMQNNPRLGEEAGRLVEARYLQERYIQGLLDEQKGLSLKGLKIVVDCANGAASSYAPEVFGRLGAQIIAIHASPNGWNINVEAGSEHVRRHMEDIRVLIKQHQASFGLAFDGDADRVIFVDEEGDLVDGDHMLGILAGYLDRLNKLMGKSVVTTNMRNQGLKTYLERLGIRLYETPVGDKYVVEILRKIRSQEREGIGLGGEQSGHIILDDDEHATGDGIRTALYVIRAYLNSGISSFSGYSETIGKVPQLIASAYVGHGQRLDRAELDMVESQSLTENAGLLRINLRYSGTEPLFRAMLESDGELSMDDLSALAVKLCRMAQQAAGIGDSTIDILNCTSGGVVRIA
jgi:phosphoglucosamine mutase